jgi:hypothetical protein
MMNNKAMNGKYVIYSGTEKIGEYPNMITTNGLEMINKYLSGQNKYWADTLVVGALSSSSTSASTAALDYEIYRYPINFKSYESTASSTNKIILKATVDPTAQFRAYELGVIPVAINPESYYDNFTITNFSEVVGGASLESQWTLYDSASIVPVSIPAPRVGSLNLPLTVSNDYESNTASIASISIDTSRYAENNFVHLLYHCTLNMDSATAVVSFGDSSNTQMFWSGSVTIPDGGVAGSAYVAQIDMGIKPDGFNDSVQYIEIIFEGSSGSIALDNMKFVLNDTLAPEDKLISRTTSASPLFTKNYSQPMEIEYHIQVT